LEAKGFIEDTFPDGHNNRDRSMVRIMDRGGMTKCCQDGVFGTNPNLNPQTECNKKFVKTH